MKKVTGIGGLFFKSKDVPRIREWYSEHLGFVTTEWGASMVWGEPDSQATGRTEWSPFKENTDYYAPSTLPYMINYRVHDVRSLIGGLRTEGVTVVGDIAEYDYGKFAYIMDPEGRKLELWEPVDTGFGDLPPTWTDKVTGLGGIFFKSDNPAKMKEWYKKHLDIGPTFRLRDLASNKETYTAWSPLDNNDKFFTETDKPYVFNYRVVDLQSLLTSLKSKGFQTSNGIQEAPNGKFGWVIDPDGNKAALWQP